MQIHHALARIALLLAALAGLQVRADQIRSLNIFYDFPLPATGDIGYGFGIRENPASVFPYYEPDATILSFASFTNAVWGTSYTINADNTPGFTAFVGQITDGEADYITTKFTSDIGNGYATIFEPVLFYGDASGLSGIDLSGYIISEIKISYEESHLFDWQNPVVQGMQTVTFFGKATAVPDTAGTVALLAIPLTALTMLRLKRAMRTGQATISSGT